VSRLEGMTRASKPRTRHGFTLLCGALLALGALAWIASRSGAPDSDSDSETVTVSPRPTAQASVPDVTPVEPVAEEPAKPRVEPSKIAGRVLVGGEPAPGANLSVLAGGTWHHGTQTDEQGRFEMSARSEATHVEVWGMGLTHRLERDMSISQWLEIELPGGKVEGHVLDAGGEPIPRIEVHTWGMTPGLVHAVRTDETGHYAMLLTPGRYMVRAGGKWRVALGSAADVLSERYGAASTVANVQDRARISADLILHAGGTIQGVARDPSGKAISLGDVRTLDRLHYARTNDRGEFELPSVAPGRVRIEVVSTPYAGRATATVRSGEISRTEIITGTGSELHVISTGPDGRLVVPRRFSIVDARGESPSADVYHFEPGGISVDIYRWGPDQLWNDGAGPDHWSYNQSGAIGVRPLLPGTYTIRASLDGNDAGVTRVVDVGTEPLYQVWLQF